MATANGFKTALENTSAKFSTRNVMISDYPDFVLQVVTHIPDPRSLRETQRLGVNPHGISGVTEFEISAAKTAPLSPWITNQLADLEGQQDRRVIWADDLSILGVEIILRALHGVVDENSYSVDVREMWHIAYAAKYLDIDTHTPALVKWFDEWYARQPRELDVRVAKLHLFPCWAFDNAEGFQKITGFLAYNNFGWIEDFMPLSQSLHPHLEEVRVPERLLLNLNLARDKLRNDLCDFIWMDILLPLLENATCQCAPETFFHIQKALRALNIWPMDATLAQIPTDNVLETLHQFNYTSPHQDCQFCSKDFKQALERIRRVVRNNFDGLCLDCFDKSAARNYRSDYWLGGSTKRYDTKCRAKHMYTSWYFSYNGHELFRRDWLRQKRRDMTPPTFRRLNMRKSPNTTPVLQNQEFQAAKTVDDGPPKVSTLNTNAAAFNGPRTMLLASPIEHAASVEAAQSTSSPVSSHTTDHVGDSQEGVPFASSIDFEASIKEIQSIFGHVSSHTTDHIGGAQEGIALFPTRTADHMDDAQEDMPLTSPIDNEASIEEIQSTSGHVSTRVTDNVDGAQEEVPSFPTHTTKHQDNAQGGLSLLPHATYTPALTPVPELLEASSSDVGPAFDCEQEIASEEHISPVPELAETSTSDVHESVHGQQDTSPEKCITPPNAETEGAADIQRRESAIGFLDYEDLEKKLEFVREQIKEAERGSASPEQIKRVEILEAEMEKKYGRGEHNISPGLEEALSEALEEFPKLRRTSKHGLEGLEVVQEESEVTEQRMDAVEEEQEQQHGESVLVRDFAHADSTDHESGHIAEISSESTTTAAEDDKPESEHAPLFEHEGGNVPSSPARAEFAKDIPILAPVNEVPDEEEKEEEQGPRLDGQEQLDIVEEEQKSPPTSVDEPCEEEDKDVQQAPRFDGQELWKAVKEHLESPSTPADEAAREENEEEQVPKTDEHEESNTVEEKQNSPPTPVDEAPEEKKKDGQQAAKLDGHEQSNIVKEKQKSTPKKGSNSSGCKPQ